MVAYFIRIRWLINLFINIIMYVNNVEIKLTIPFKKRQHTYRITL